MAQLYFLLFVTLISAKAAAQESNVSSKETLYVLSQLPYPVPNSAGLLPSWQEGAPVAQALNLAARQINNRTDLLPNYNLELEHINGGCDYIDVAVTNLAESVASLLERKNRRFVGLIGPGCSLSTFGIAPLTNRSDLSMITIHGAGASVFSNRESYPYYFGSLGSNEGYGELAVALMRKTGWRKTALLFHEERLYYNTLTNEVKGAVSREFSDAEIVFSSMVRLNNFYPLDELQSSRARIIFVFVPLDHLRQIICLAYHNGMIYPAYQWVYAVEVTLAEFIASSNNVSFTYDDQTYECTHANFEAALNNNFFMNYRLIPFDRSVESVANLNFTEYYKLYQQEIEQYNSNYTNPFRNISTTVWAAYFYDSLWALAIALHNVTEKHHLNLSEYRYKDENITQLIAEELYNVDFNGNSGPINYRRETGFLVREIDLTQIINYTEVFTAYSNAGQIVKVRSFDFIEDTFEARNQGVAHQGVAALFSIIASLQLVVIFVLHILTIVYRNENHVKASSPKLNHVAFVGAYLMGATIIVSAVNDHPTVSYEAKGNICTAIWAWLLPISFTLQLAPIVARTWRLYRIFAHYLDPGHFISNPALFTFVFILVAIDLTIAVIWTSFDPYRIIETESKLQVGPATFIMVQLGCRCRYIYAWFGIVFSFKIATLLVLFVLALLTRKIKGQSYTTASLRVLGYLLFIVFVLGFFLYIFFVIGDYNPNLDFSVLSITLNTMVFLFTICIFIPPLFLLFRDKYKDKYSFGKIKFTSVKSEMTTTKVKRISVDSTWYLM